MGPEPSKALIDAILSHDMTKIHYMSERIAWSNAPLNTILQDPELFASYNIQVEKARMEMAGYCAPGPTRPPYNFIPDDIAEISRECGRRWKALRQEIAK